MTSRSKLRSPQDKSTSPIKMDNLSVHQALQPEHSRKSSVITNVDSLQMTQINAEQQLPQKDAFGLIQSLHEQVESLKEEKNALLDFIEESNERR